MMTNERINWYEKDSDEVLDVIYEKIDDDRKRWTFLKHLITKFPDLKIKWLEIFEDFKEILVKEEKIDEILFFINWYNKKFPGDYIERYEFLERDLCNYYLFKKDFQALQKRIDFLGQYPVFGIDIVTLPLLFQLIYHGKYQMAVDFASRVWKPIQDSADLIGMAEFDFVNVIYVNELQKYYESILNNTPFNKDKFFNKTVELGYNDDKIHFNNILISVNSDLDIEQIRKSIKEKKEDHFIHLNIGFLKYMFHEFNMPFIFSEQLWHFFATTKIFGKHGKMDWFFIDAKTMDKHIVDNFDHFLGSNILQVFGKVWGLDYMTSFFFHSNLITYEQYQIMSENNNYFKNEFIKIAAKDLWQMMFVFDWPESENSRKNPHDINRFKNTFKMTNVEAFNNVADYISEIPIPYRIEKELKLNEVVSSPDFYAESTPYVKEEKKIGRNDPCPCGSGKKYKKCCLNK